MLTKIQQINNPQTPFYLYDKSLLQRTLDTIKKELRPNYHVHYAVKANANADVLRLIANAGLGADCVSGGEIEAAVAAGFSSNDIVYAGVGKSDWEIKLGLEHGIFCFNVESVPELEVINSLAEEKGIVARVAFRINPNVGAHTHHNIATGLAENKFGIDIVDMIPVIRRASEMSNVKFVGLHFHIGSQILEMDDFAALCVRINELQDKLEAEGIASPENINVGGGLGIDYQNPDANPIPDFHSYFETYSKYLKLREGQHLHFELGRSVVAQMGSLITSVLYVKENPLKKFVIVDGGMSDLIRPALYQAYHLVQNLTSVETKTMKCDVVGPICESSDVFVEGHTMPLTQRGDLLALRSAGAYGEIMASHYNCRQLPKSYLL